MADESGSLATDLAAMANVFIDPAATVKSIDRKWLWLWPVLITAIVGTVFAVILVPISVQLGLQASTQAQSMTPEQLQRGLSLGIMIGKIIAFLSPIWVVLKLLLLAWLLSVACSIMSMKATFRQLFTLLSVCSLIQLLQAIATYIVIRSKGEIQTLEELMPPFGMDIFVRGETSKFLLAFLNFFSLFEIWYLVILAIGLAALTNSSKGKAFAAITPVWVLPLLFVLVGAAFRR